MRKTPLKKRVTRNARPLSNVDPTRLALAALERIRTVLARSGHDARLGGPLSMKELAAQAKLLGAELPPSYAAAMRVASKIGEPLTFLGAREMDAEAQRLAAVSGEEARRYLPFCRELDHVICFDKGGESPATTEGAQELPIVGWRGGMASPVAAHFGEWLDALADTREESLERAARMPPRLKRLLYELGFRFEYPVVGRVETADVAAVLELIGSELARTVRGSVDRLFDASGKAVLTLNVDEFKLTAALRTGIYMFEAEEVFRWLRTFRDENFFNEATTHASHPDLVRDLRRAPREAALAPPGVVHVAVAPARKLVFRAASGRGANDFHLLAHADRSTGHAQSVILHVIDGEVAGSQEVDEVLVDLHATRDGTVWGLTMRSAIRLAHGRAQTYPLPGSTPDAPRWSGIGEADDRIVVWGHAALLEFAGREFVAFEPDARLDDSESVVALHTRGERIWMLVSGDLGARGAPQSEPFGAVARFDGVGWQPIAENQVIHASLVDLDVWRDTAWVLDRARNVWKIDDGEPRRVSLATQQRAYVANGNVPRSLLGIRTYDKGLLLASHGGVIEVGSGEPIFHAIPDGREPMRLLRVGRVRSAASMAARDLDANDAAIVALAGPHAWMWSGDAFRVLDMTDW